MLEGIRAKIANFFNLNQDEKKSAAGEGNKRIKNLGSQLLVKSGEGPTDEVKGLRGRCSILLKSANQGFTKFVERTFFGKRKREEYDNLAISKPNVVNSEKNKKILYSLGECSTTPFDQVDEIYTKNEDSLKKIGELNRKILKSPADFLNSLNKTVATLKKTGKIQNQNLSNETVIKEIIGQMNENELNKLSSLPEPTALFLSEPYKAVMGAYESL